MNQSPSPASASGSPKLLHLGCGMTTPPEWVNVDGSMNAWLSQRPLLRKVVGALRLVPKSQLDIAWANNVTIADLRKPLPFPDNSFDAVFSSHFLEHLHRNEALAVLKESRRVLKPGGLSRHMVPDLASIVHDYLEYVELDKKGLPYNPDAAGDPARHMVNRLLMREENSPRRGLIYSIYQSRTDFHPHKWMYDGPALAKLMKEAGFTDCRERGYLESSIAHLDKVERRDRADSAAIVEGVKA